eukprot:g946.t1
MKTDSECVRRGYKNREEARVWANEALTMFRKEGNKKMEAYTLICLLNINMTLPQWKWRGDKKISCQDGFDCAVNACSIFKAIGEGLAMHGVAVAQVRAEVNEVVLQGATSWEAAADEAVRLFRESGQKRMEAFERVCVAQWYMGINPRKAMKLAEDVMKLCQELRCRQESAALSVLVQAHLQLKEGLSMFERGVEQESARAVQLAKNGFDRFRDLGDRQGQATALHALVLAHQARGEKAQALQTAEEAADIYKEIGEKGGETSMLQIVSQLHLELARPDKAFQVAQEVASMDISLHETAVAQETVSPEAEDLATRSEDLAAVVDEEDLEPSSAMAAALAAMASAVQTLQNTPEPVMESGGQVVDEDDDDTVAAEVPPEPCEVEVDLEVDLEEETFRPTPPSTPAPSAPSPVPQLLEGLRAANRMKSQEVQSENLTLEELEDQLLLQKVLVKQLKADYEQRLERSEALAAELRDLQGSKPQDLQVKVVRARDETEKLSKEGNRAAMWVEDRLARAWRLFQSRTPSQRLARDLAKKSHAELEALRRSRGHVEEDVALEVLQSQRRRIDVMKQDATAQDEKLLSLGSDLRSVLDFMVRVNLDARGGPNGPLGELPELQNLNFSEEMQQVAEVLARPEPKKSAGPEELLRAAAWGELRTLKELLSVPMEATEELCGWTVWHSAAAHGQDKVIRFLQEHATEGLDALCDCGLPPLGITCLRGHLGTAKCLLEAKCTVSAHDVRGNSALHWAAASHSHQAAEELAELLLDASADPFACNGSGQLPDIPRLQELALRSSERRDSVPRSPRPRTDAAPPDAARHGAGGEEEVPRFSYIRLEKKSTSGGFLSSLSFLKPPVRDRAGLMRRAEARRAVHLSPEEEDVGIWSDWVTVFTHAGLSACVAPAPAPSSDPTNSACNTQALVLTSERLLFLRAASTGAAVRSGWSLAQGMALRQIRQVVIPGRSDGLLLLRVQTSDEVLSLSAIDRSTLAFLSGNLFVLLPRAPSSLLLSGAETIRFGFLELQMLGPAAPHGFTQQFPKDATAAQASWCWSLLAMAAVLLPRQGREAPRAVLGLVVTQVKSVRGSAGEACVVIQSQNQIVATVKARGSREREDWLDALRRLGRLRKDFTQCILVAREAQVLLHDLSAFIDEAAAVRMVAEAYLANGELPQAVKAAERSLRLLKGKRKEAEEIQSMLVLASVKLQVLVQDKVRAQRGTPTFNVALEDALDAAEQAVHLAREKRMAQLGQALLTLGPLGRASRAIAARDLAAAAQAMEIAEAAGAEREKANVMCLEADIHFTNGNANKALVLVNKALAIFQEYRDSRGEWIAMNILEQITGPPEDGNHFEPRARRRTDPGEKLELAHVSTDTVRKRVEEIVRFTADLDDNEPIELDQPLMQVGVTSRTAVGLRNMLSEELPGVDLPFTLIFDYPSVASISVPCSDSLGAVGMLAVAARLERPTKLLAVQRATTRGTKKCGWELGLGEASKVLGVRVEKLQVDREDKAEDEVVDTEEDRAEDERSEDDHGEEDRAEDDRAEESPEEDKAEVDRDDRAEDEVVDTEEDRAEEERSEDDHREEDRAEDAGGEDEAPFHPVLYTLHGRVPGSTSSSSGREAGDEAGVEAELLEEIEELRMECDRRDAERAKHKRPHEETDNQNSKIPKKSMPVPINLDEEIEIDTPTHESGTGVSAEDPEAQEEGEEARAEGESSEEGDRAEDDREEDRGRAEDQSCQSSEDDKEDEENRSEEDKAKDESSEDEKEEDRAEDVRSEEEKTNDDREENKAEDQSADDERAEDVNSEDDAEDDREEANAEQSRAVDAREEDKAEDGNSDDEKEEDRAEDAREDNKTDDGGSEDESSEEDKGEDRAEDAREEDKADDGKSDDEKENRAEDARQEDKADDGGSEDQEEDRAEDERAEDEKEEDRAEAASEEDKAEDESSNDKRDDDKAEDEGAEDDSEEDRAKEKAAKETKGKTKGSSKSKASERPTKKKTTVTVLQLEKTYGKSKEAKAFIQSIIGGALDFFEWMKERALQYSPKAPQSARGYSGAVAAEAQAPQEALLKKKAAVMLQSAWRRRAAQLRFERHLLDLIFPQRPEGPSTPMATLSSLCLVQGLLRRVWRSLRRRGLDFELAYRCADAGYQKKAGTSAADGSSMRVGHFLHFLCQQQGLPPAELSALLRLFKRRDRGNRVAGTAGEVKARIQTCFGV